MATRGRLLEIPELPGFVAERDGEAQRRSTARVWLITTNGNTDALRLYQRLGFVLVALHRDAVTRSRHDLKPEIPAMSAAGIPIRDEIELELPSARWPAFVAEHAWPSS